MVNNTAHYWVGKEDRAQVSIRHTKEMNEKYGNEIEKAIKNTKIYTTKFRTRNNIKNETGCEISVEALDSVSAVYKYKNCGKVAVLNFASYKNPGGGFIQGSKAQEECLCHESFLYNVLDKFRGSYYWWNNQHKNNALYLNRALYTPDAIFTHNEEEFKCDVITCAAPNKTTAQKYRNVSDANVANALKSRIKFVLDVAEDNYVDTLILGAYGCGIFGQNPIEVATIFKDFLDTTHKYFGKVIFAIPNGRDNNLSTFERVFNS